MSPTSATALPVLSVNEVLLEQRPEQKVFTKDEKVFMQKYLEEFLVATVSAKSKRGDKKDWVETHVYPKYVKEFDSARIGGPNLASLLKVSGNLHSLTKHCVNFSTKKMRCWYTNQVGKQDTSPPKASQPANKPRATNAVELFGRDRKDELVIAVAKKVQEDGLTAPGANLVEHAKLKNAMYEELPDEEKEKWQVLALEHNQSIKQPPSPDYIVMYVTFNFDRNNLT